MTSKNKGHIKVKPFGPYLVEGDVALVKKTQIVSEFGEPLNWKKDGDIPHAETYELCRCGHSKEKPFCDSSHCDIDFEGTEDCPTPTPSLNAPEVDERGVGIVVKSDFSTLHGFGVLRQPPHQDPQDGPRNRRTEDPRRDHGHDRPLPLRHLFLLNG